MPQLFMKKVIAELLGVNLLRSGRQNTPDSYVQTGRFGRFGLYKMLNSREGDGEGVLGRDGVWSSFGRQRSDARS
jgi:hypothetical protein